MVDSVLAMPEGSKLMLLAPVVRDRKGEHLHVFEELRGAGFVRARVDGTVRELDDLPDLDKKKKHSIEVVVDRFKVREDIKLRLAESFETALELTDGLALVVDMDGEAADQVFSARFACPECGHSINELEPRLFSFNNPAGACASCDGLGVRQFFDPERMVLYPDSSLAEGAIRGWDRRNVYYFHMLSSLAEHYGFDIDTPFRNCRRSTARSFSRAVAKRRSVSPTSTIAATCSSARTLRGHPAQHGTPLPRYGIAVRARGSVQVPVHRTLRPNAAAVACARTRATCWWTTQPAGDHRMPVGEAEDYFESIEARRPGCTDRRQDSQGNPRALSLPRGRGIQLPDPGPQRRNPVRRRGPAHPPGVQIGAGLVGVMYILDEPSIGLHQRDNERLLRTLTHLRDLGNTVLVVEHDEDAIRSADHVIDIGPGAGVHGGTIVAEGMPRGDHGRGALPDRRLPLGSARIEVPSTAPRRTRNASCAARRHRQQPAGCRREPSPSAC
jgi:excinuclease ABC subunit A